jgi:putative transcriptional regulator
MTGISISALSEIGRGDTTKISFDTLDKICAALECQVGDLLVWKPNEEKRSADRKRISR